MGKLHDSRCMQVLVYYIAMNRVMIKRIEILKFLRYEKYSILSSYANTIRVTIFLFLPFSMKSDHA